MEVLDSRYVDENDTKADSTPEVEEGALAVAIYEGGQKEGGNVDDMEDSGVFDGSALEDTSNIEVDSETANEVMQKMAALSKGPPFAPIFVLPAPANHVQTTKSSIQNVAPVPSPGVLKEDNRLPAAKKQRMEYPTSRAISAMNRCTARHAQEGLTTAVLDEMAKVQKAVNIVEKMRKYLHLMYPKPPIIILANKNASVPCPIAVGQLALPAPADHVQTTKSSIPNVAPVPSPGVLKEDNRLPAAKKQRMEHPALRAISAMNRCTARHAQEGVSTAVLDEMAKVQKAVNAVENMRKDLRRSLSPLSAYNLFCMVQRNTVRIKKRLSVERELGRMWRALNYDEKQVYYDRAHGLIRNDTRG